MAFVASMPALAVARSRVAADRLAAKLVRLDERCGGIVDQPFSALAGFGDGGFFSGVNNAAVPRSPRLAAVGSVDAVQRAPRFVGWVVDLPGRRGDVETFVFECVVHGLILASCRHGAARARRLLQAASPVRGYAESERHARPLARTRAPFEAVAWSLPLVA